MIWIRDWLRSTFDRLAFWRQPGERLEREIRRWMADNAKRNDVP